VKSGCFACHRAFLIGFVMTGEEWPTAALTSSSEAPCGT
jgi:hypothetical protein